jgi:NAD(P)-dependent dehydrogenase (short-subunit alcohol dehydrogenase family)
VVLGGSRGLGFHAARAIASLGCHVLLVARGVEGLRRAASEISEVYPVEVDYVAGDLRVEGTARGAVRRAVSRWGRVDHVVAAYGNVSGEPLEIHEAGWRDWMEAAALYVASTGELVRALVEENPGRATLLLISSFTVAEPMSPLVVSDAARAALSRIVRVAARRYPGRVRPILLLAGSFPTPGALATVERIARRRGVDPGELWVREVEGRSPLRRSGSLLEFERLVASILRAPEYLTGATILFDGASSRVAWP